MSMESILFYLFATVLVVSAAMVVTIRNPVKAALFLVLSFFSAACIWMTLEAEFLSIALVLVYVGAVMVLFLFVVMMLDIAVESMREGFARNLPGGALVAGVMVVEFAVVMMSDRFDSQSLPRPAGHGPDYSNTKELGLVLYTDYVFAFEVAGLILLVAIVAAIVLRMRRRPNTRYQSPSEQVKVNKSERLRIVSMPAEKRLDIDN